jgi:hypothetical protein
MIVLGTASFYSCRADVSTTAARRTRTDCLAELPLGPKLGLQAAAAGIISKIIVRRYN